MGDTGRTPGRLVAQSSETKGGLWILRTEDHNYRADVYGRCAEGDAKHLALCWNSHEQIVKCATELLDIIDQGDTRANYYAACDRLRAALKSAQAKG